MIDPIDEGEPVYPLKYAAEQILLDPHIPASRICSKQPATYVINSAYHELAKVCMLCSQTYSKLPSRWEALDSNFMLGVPQKSSNAVL